MLFYAVNRLALAIAIVVVVIAVLFCMVYVIPGDPVRIALGPLATPEMVASFRAKMGLDQPLLVQFTRFFASVLKGDLGTDILSNRGVATSVFEQMPYTLTLIVSSMLWAVAIGIPLGCYAAIHRGSLFDRIIGVLSVAVIAIPSFVIAVYALLIFAVHLGWFPAIGAGRPGAPFNQLHHLVLPSLAVGLGWVGYLARVVRASMLEVMGENYIRTARAFGLPRRTIVYRYALPIAVLPTITLLGVGIGHMLSGAVFAEIVFARPGVGKLVYDAINARNYPLVSGTVLITTAFYVLATLIADLFVAGLDPRVRANLR
ncbi:MAG TPA: ABC transporter permease [Aestuariivirgaceae bacterium]|jgi:peptide/nickel transport system permease protein